MWEDKQNKAGGRWLLNMEKRKKDSIDWYWEETVRWMGSKERRGRGMLGPVCLTTSLAQPY